MLPCAAQVPFVAAYLLHLVWDAHQDTPKSERPRGLVVRKALVDRVLEVMQQPPSKQSNGRLWVMRLLCWYAVFSQGKKGNFRTLHFYDISHGFQL